MGLKASRTKNYMTKNLTSNCTCSGKRDKVTCNYKCRTTEIALRKFLFKGSLASGEFFKLEVSAETDKAAQEYVEEAYPTFTWVTMINLSNGS